MRILYFSTDYGPHDRRFLASLARTRHDVHFLRLMGTSTSSEGDDIPADIHPLNWAGLRGPFRWWNAPTLAMDLRRLVKDLEPDLIHAGPVQTCALVAVLSGFRPVLTMSWGFDLMQDAERDPVWRWATRFTLQRSSYFVSDANVTRERAIAYGIPRQRTAVFPWGVDLKQFHPGARRAQPVIRAAARVPSRHAIPRRRPQGMVILCNRSWEARYGVDVMARAFVMAAGALPGATLILLGAGSQGEKIRSILERGGRMGRVQFGGHVRQSEIHRWYRKADLFVSPSHVDGSSVSLMEAMASGTPPLVSDIPANREWVKHNVNGWLFRDGDPEDLAQRLIWIAGRRAALNRIGRAARKTAEQRADWTRNFKVLLESYEQVGAQGTET